MGIYDIYGYIYSYVIYIYLFMYTVYVFIYLYLFMPSGLGRINQQVTVALRLTWWFGNDWDLARLLFYWSWQGWGASIHGTKTALNRGSKHDLQLFEAFQDHMEVWNINLFPTSLRGHSQHVVPGLLWRPFRLLVYFTVFAIHGLW